MAEYLSFTRDRLVNVLTGLSEQQWNFKPKLGCWSIADILEHLVIIESRVQAIVNQMPNAPLAEPGRSDSEVEAIILAEVPNRSFNSKRRLLFVHRSSGVPRNAWRAFSKIGRLRSSCWSTRLPCVGMSFRIPYLVPGMAINGSSRRRPIATDTSTR